MEGHSKGTSSVAFEVLIIKSETDFINLFIFNCVMSNINLFIFNYKFIQLQLVTSNFCFRRTYFSQAEENGCFLTLLLRFGFSTQPGKNYYYSYVSQQPSFESFSRWFWWECKTWFCFSLHALTPSFCNFVSFSLAINVT